MEQSILISKNHQRVFTNPATMDKKGQGWSLDLTIAMVIFITGIVVLYVYAINYSSQSQKQLEEMFYEGNLAAELILSEDDFGILTDNKVNQTKLDDFYNNYDSKKISLGVVRDFYFTMDDLWANEVPVNYVGKMNTTNSENIIQITRISIYKDKPAKFQLYVWS